MPPKKGKKESSAAASSSEKSGDADTATLASTMLSAAGTNPEENRIDGRQLVLASEALTKTKQLRNFFQLERDKIYAFWCITKKELGNIHAALRNKEREIEEMKERHKVEMKAYKQKVRHLLYEQKVQTAELKTESERSLKNKLEEHREKEADFKRDKRQLKQEWKDHQLQYDEEIHRMKQDNDKEVTLLMQQFERNMKEMQMKYEKRIKNLREDMEVRRKAEIDDIERRKTDHVQKLMAEHDKAFQDIREYYNDITSNNLELIKNLKEQVSNMKRNEAYNEKLMFEIAQENKRLTEPLTKAYKEVNLLQHELANYEKDKQSLDNAKERLRSLEDQFKTLSWENEVLLQRFQKVQEERDKLYERYQTTLHEVQQKAVFRNVVLKKKIEVLAAQMEKKDAQLGEILRNATAMDSGSVVPVERRMEDMLATKDALIEELQKGLTEVTEQHSQIVNAYEEYLATHGVPGLLP